uniref:Transmembrane protein 70 n=1 Tax=Ciona savignyi TaxID=51511 RepID=H2ZM57_CIOSA
MSTLNKLVSHFLRGKTKQLLLSSSTRFTQHCETWNVQRTQNICEFERLYDVKRHFHKFSVLQNKKEPSSNKMGELLYVGQDRNKIKWTLGTFYMLSASVGIASPFLFKLTSGSLVATGFLAFNVFVFVLLNPLGLYQFGKRYVNELYYEKHSDTYTANLLSPFVFKQTRLRFSPAECKMPANPSVFTSFFVGKHPLFVNSDAMNYHDYMKMLRFASTIDYENPDRQEKYEAVKKEKKSD